MPDRPRAAGQLRGPSRGSCARPPWILGLFAARASWSAAWPDTNIQVGTNSQFTPPLDRGTQGGPCGCSRPLAERSLKYPSYTNLRDRKMGAGLLIQTNRMYGRGVPLGQTHSSPTRPAQACPRRAGSPAFRAAWKHIRITFVHRKTTVG